jgi:hypothetical protein
MAKASRKAQRLEGEGSYTAARQYDSNVRSFVKKGGEQAAASAARDAVEGDEAGELAQAEKRGKAGPRATSSKPTAASGRKVPQGRS